MALHSIIVLARKNNRLAVTNIIVRIGIIRFQARKIIIASHQFILSLSKAFEHSIRSCIDKFILPSGIFGYLIEVIHHQPMAAPIRIFFCNPFCFTKCYTKHTRLTLRSHRGDAKH